MNIKEYIEKIKKKEIDIVEQTKKAVYDAKKINDEFSYFSEITEDLAIKQAEALKQNPKGKLAGLYITIKDCICLKGVATHASSRILDNYKPVFDATVVEKLKKEGAIIIGKTLQDEFGFGSFSINTGIGFSVPKNPFDKDRATGGSSGGSGGFSQKFDYPHVSIAESTGGSIVSPASLCGVYGLCPSYGRVSRYGLLDYGSSLDKIGPISKDIEAIALVMEVIAGKDEKDSTSSDIQVDNYSNKENIKPKIAIVKESYEKNLSKEVKEKFVSFLEKLKKEYEVDEISLPLTYKYGVAAYYIIAQSESSTNLAKYCGLRYGKTLELRGNFNEYFSSVRTEFLGREAKRRIMLGTFTRMVGFRDAYYIKAMKVRSKIIKEYKKAFEKYDIILTPTLPFVAPRFDEIKKMSLSQIYLSDNLTVGPNLAGLPHINIPLKGGLPVGIMAIADHFNEKILIDFAR
jgi:aspartyl-tRNA(Asn)/glutamyl-tRNA(Gln) amidotransferase subunit A